jgi:NADH-quinone oxidoreductase subunit L
LGFLLLILLPLIGSALQGILGIKNTRKTGLLASLFIFIPLIINIFLFNFDIDNLFLIPWIKFSEFEVNFSFSLEKINILMGFTVLIVSFLVHFYSIGYMEHDKSPYRYFSFLNLFVFFMLIIVYSDNLLLMFMGWEGVGLCSYLLISYETWRDDAKNAGTKAFFVTRFADFGFILAILIYYKIFGTFELSALKNANYSMLFLPLGIFLLIAACGKSAQFPFYIWLPDAMEGPTPVSALIHAATMVTAGVWLLIKTFKIFLIAPFLMDIVIFVGIITILLSAYIAVFERDLKKILAYSTISQIGYMFFAVGLSYPILGFLHLFTHAFFKALLFLTSGDVMHAIHKKIDIFETRGMRKYLPLTAFGFLVGALALSAFPFTGGFVSKELILQASFNKKNLFFLASLGSFLTAFYIFRGYTLCFEGKPNKIEHITKPEIYQKFSIILLSIFTILTGLPVSEKFYFDYFEKHIHFKLPLMYLLFPLFLAITGIYLGVSYYFERTPPLRGRYYNYVELSRKGFYYDFFISKVIFGIIKTLANIFYRFFDRGIIDLGFVEGTGKISLLSGKMLYRLFRRNISFYLLILFLFFILIFLKIN